MSAKTPEVSKPAPQRLELFGRRTGPAAPIPWRTIFAVIGSVLATAGALWFLNRIHTVIYWVTVAIFASLILEPAVDWLARRGWRRGLATGLVMLISFVALMAFIALMAPLIITEVTNLVKSVPGWLNSMSKWTMANWNIDVSPAAIEKQLSAAGTDLQSLAGRLASNALSILGNILGKLFDMASIGLLTFYFVAEAPKLRRTICSLLARDRQEDVLWIWEIAIQKTGAFIYSRLFLGIVNGGLFYIVLKLLGTPYAEALAVWLGLVSQFIPVVGAYLAAALPIIVALAEQGPGPAIVIVIYTTAYQQFENLFLMPKIAGRTMKLHPAVAFAAATAGVFVGGIVWAFMALPIVAVIQAVVSASVERRAVVDTELTRGEPKDEYDGPIDKMKRRARRDRKDMEGPAGPDVEPAGEAGAEDRE